MKRVITPTLLLMIVVTVLIYWELDSTIKGCERLETQIPEAVETLELQPITETETMVETETETEAESEYITETETPQTETYMPSDDGYRFRENVPLPDELQKYIHDKCQEYSVPEYLLYGLMENESHFRYDLISDTDDYGICQINKCNHASLSAELGISDFLDPYQGALAGIKMLSNALTLGGGNERRALMIYHNPKCAYEDWDVGIYTSAYAETVMASAEKYK